MRDRLIELLKEYHAHPEKACPRSTYEPCDGCKYDKGGECDRDGKLADHLLAEGVIVPPCKVGDTVYSISRKPLGGHWEDNRYIVDKWDELKVCEIPFSLTLWECGWNGIFLTKEEAERALAERREG